MKMITANKIASYATKFFTTVFASRSKFRFFLCRLPAQSTSYVKKNSAKSNDFQSIRSNCKMAPASRSHFSRRSRFIYLWDLFVLIYYSTTLIGSSTQFASQHAVGRYSINYTIYLTPKICWWFPFQVSYPCAIVSTFLLLFFLLGIKFTLLWENRIAFSIFCILVFNHNNHLKSN